MKHWWRVGLAAECCGAMRSAVDFTVEHVKNRRQFGRPLASLQVIQHRLAAGAQNAETARWMTLRAAWSGAPLVYVALPVGSNYGWGVLGSVM